MIAAIIILIIMLGFVTFFLVQSKKTIQKLHREIEGQQQSIEKENQLTIMNQKIKYDVLQSQINPHFLYNTLENIRGRAIIDGNYVVAEMTEALAKYFRYNISKDGDIVTLAQEIENINTYIKIQRYRFNERIVFNIYVHVDEEHIKTCKIPKMTLQPIVENAIFYGVEKKTAQGHVNVDVDIIGKCVNVVVSDDGQGMKKEQLDALNHKIQTGKEIHSKNSHEKGTGIALVNINKRIQLLYGEDYGMSVSSTWDVGTQVSVVFPYVKSVQS